MRPLFVHGTASTSAFLQHGHARDVRCSLVVFVVTARMHACMHLCIRWRTSSFALPSGVGASSSVVHTWASPVKDVVLLEFSKNRPSCFRPCRYEFGEKHRAEGKQIKPAWRRKVCGETQRGAEGDVTKKFAVDGNQEQLPGHFTHESRDNRCAHAHQLPERDGRILRGDCQKVKLHM